VKTKLIIIEGKQVGIVGLEEVFEEFYRDKRGLDRSLKNLIFGRLKDLNYIPSDKEEAYASAIWDEYMKFCARKEGKIREEKDLGTWQGIPREEIPWYPTLLKDLCDGCMMCLKFCPYGVFEPDEKNEKVLVVHPFYCEVGCSMCAVKCKPKAISFPPLGILETFRRR
jgi:Pyruvate/2-oxoacid:ferredoxin oxidoreductase delta subunit